MSTEQTVSNRVRVQRSAYDLQKFDKKFGRHPPQENSCLKCLKGGGCCCTCNPRWVGSQILAFFPFIDILRTYKWKKWLYRDLIAGLSTGVVHIPQGMGFAISTGVSPVFGLYSSFWPVLVYFFFGTSRHISLGTMAIISIVLSAPVERAALKFRESLPATLAPPVDSNGTLLTLKDDDLNAQEEAVRAGAATLVTLMVGLVQLGMGLFRLGFVTTFMSTSFISGFTTGAAFHIVTSQITSLLGISIPRRDGLFKVPYTWYELAIHITDTNLATMTVGLICGVILIALKEGVNEKFRHKLKVPVPAELIVVVLGTVCSYFIKLNERYEVKVVGLVPLGFPSPSVPPLGDAMDYIADAVIAAILSFAVSVSLANIFSQKYRYTVESNQELYAYGLCHTVGSFFGCFAGAAAPPRCFVMDTSGGKTQVASLFSCFLLMLVLLAMGTWFQTLPITVLAAVIIVAIFPLMRQFRDLRTYWHVNKVDTFIWLVTWASVVGLNVDYGIGIGMLFSIITVVAQTLQAKGFVMGFAKGPDLYAPLKKYERVKKIDGVCIFKFESNLYFASIKAFKQQLFRATLDPNGALKEVYKDKSKMLRKKAKRIAKGRHRDWFTAGNVDEMGLNSIGTRGAVPTSRRGSPRRAPLENGRPSQQNTNASVGYQPRGPPTTADVRFARFAMLYGDMYETDPPRNESRRPPHANGGVGHPRVKNVAFNSAFVPDEDGDVEVKGNGVYSHHVQENGKTANDNSIAINKINTEIDGGTSNSVNRKTNPEPQTVNNNKRRQSVFEGIQRKFSFSRKISATKLEDKWRAIILDCSTFTYIDVMGVQLLKMLHVDYKAIGVRFVLACCNQSMLHKLESAGVVENPDVMSEEGRRLIADDIIKPPSDDESEDTGSIKTDSDGKSLAGSVGKLEDNSKWFDKIRWDIVGQLGGNLAGNLKDRVTNLRMKKYVEEMRKRRAERRKEKRAKEIYIPVYPTVQDAIIFMGWDPPESSSEEETESEMEEPQGNEEMKAENENNDEEKETEAEIEDREEPSVEDDGASLEEDPLNDLDGDINSEASIAATLSSKASSAVFRPSLSISPTLGLGGEPDWTTPSSLLAA